MKSRFWLSTLLSVALLFSAAAETNTPVLKKRSAFFPPEILAQIQANAKKDRWSGQMREDIVANTKRWMELSDEELWDLMFGATLPRSWMVWSNGHCPACKKSVEMYNWKSDGWNHPWKVRCPNCKELFPKNDFEAYYKSGLDEHGVFSPAQANKSLLFNTEHPDPADPLHKFGVDDGFGYVADGKRWWFIAAYIIRGQFQEKIIGGIDTLAAAYVMTGDVRYAHKAAVLLDRVADLYPTFDFAKQGYVYEVGNIAGYVSVWHDASEETYEMVLAYDQIFEGIRNDTNLVAFLSKQAENYKLPNPKRSFEDIQRNIEGRILRDALASPAKIHSNFPRRECTEIAIRTVLAWPENRADVEKQIDHIIKAATAVDGVTGEKGLANYGAYTIAALGRFLHEYVRSEPEFLEQLLKRNPTLRQSYRFHIDTHCLGRYYPLSGDTGSFAQAIPKNPVTIYTKFTPGNSFRAPLSPSMTSFFWQLYRQTGDPTYVQTIYRENGNSITNLPYDVFEKDPQAVRKSIKQVISKYGPEVNVGSIDKKQWRIALLRSGSGKNARVATLDYDAGGAHGHFDAMNLGLFAHGLDLLPDFGYPPVQFGGWTTPRANWYKMSAAHNTVVVDKRDSVTGGGTTTLWADGEQFRAMRASGAGLVGSKQFERTVSLVDISAENFYVLDLFRIVGGSEHTKFIHGHFAILETKGLSLKPIANDFSSAFQLKDFESDTNANPGWSVTWNVEDRHHLLTNQTVHMAYTDLTTSSEAVTAKAWLVPAYNTQEKGEVWNPCVLTRRRGAVPLASTFVGVLEPYGRKSSIASMRRLPLKNSAGETLPDSNVAVEIKLTDGRTDLIIAHDVENPLKQIAAKEDGLIIQEDLKVQLQGELAWIRFDKRGRVERAAIANAQLLKVGATEVATPQKTSFAEFKLRSGKLKPIESTKMTEQAKP